MGVLRINRSIRWHCWAFVVLCIGCLLSVTAWLVSVPTAVSSTSSTTKVPINRHVDYILSYSNRRNTLLQAIGGKGNNNNGKKKSRSSNKKKKDKDRKKDSSSSSSDSSPGFFKSITKRFGDRKEAKKAKKQAELEKKLTEILDREDKNDSSNMPFDFSAASAITEALEGFEKQLVSARDELRKVRATQETPTAEEIRLEELRRRARKERERREKALKFNNKSSSSSKEESKKKEDDKEHNQNQDNGNNKRGEKTVARKGEKEDSSTEGKQRKGTLSVVQTFFSGVFENQREEWIPVAPKTRISPGEIVPISAAGLDLLLVASKDGSALHCIANSCPHLGTPLEVGMLERRPIETSSSDQQQQQVMLPASELQETDIASLLAQDGCEDCIVCPLHKTAFALESGEVRGEWCPYPPVIGKVMGTVKTKATLPVFDVRTRGKNIEVRLNTPLEA